MEGCIKEMRVCVQRKEEGGWGNERNAYAYNENEAHPQNDIHPHSRACNDELVLQTYNHSSSSGTQTHQQPQQSSLLIGTKHSQSHIKEVIHS